MNMLYQVNSLRSVVLFMVGTFTMSLHSHLLSQEIDVWLGTSGSPHSKGIYHCTLDEATGRLSESKLVAEVRGPGFLAKHPSREVLYAVGDDVPSVIAYQITGSGSQATLTRMNSIPIGDGGAAHVSVHPSGKLLLTAQYGGGSVGVFSLNEDGSLAKKEQIIEHEGGSGVVADRQREPHPHWTGYSPDAHLAFVPDLGMDAVVIYDVDLEAKRLSPRGKGEVPGGGGPRHMKFHPNGKWIYVLNELSLAVSLFDFDAQSGTMTLRQTIPTVSAEEVAAEQFASSSEIRVHPNGKFVYAANRGHDTITAFSVAEDGQLTEIQNENVRGATPRNFNLTPSGKWLLAGGQESHTLAAFAVDNASGRLTYNRSVISTPAPICILFRYEDRPGN